MKRHSETIYPTMLKNGLDNRHNSGLQKIQKHVLKVNVDCEGCQKKVWKLLKKIDGVYSIDINRETQEVTVSGTVHSATLIKKLNAAGKYAELSPPKLQLLQAAPVSTKQHMLPISVGDVVEDLGGSFRNQNTGMGSVVTNPADLMAMARLRDVYRDEDGRFGGWNNIAASNRPQAGYHGADQSSFGFSGMPSYEVNHQPSMEIVNSQQGSYRYFPSADMNNGYAANRRGNSDMRFNAYQQPEMISYSPSSFPHAVAMDSIDYNRAAAQQPYHYVGYQ